MHRHSLSVCVAGAGAGRRGAEGRQYFIHACQYYEAELEIHIIVMGKSAQQDDAPEPRHWLAAKLYLYIAEWVHF